MPRPPKPGYDRSVMRIEITQKAIDRLNGISEETGITLIHMESKVIQWFHAQDSTLQAAILGLYPEMMEKDVPTMILEAMGK